VHVRPERCTSCINPLVVHVHFFRPFHTYLLGGCGLGSLSGLDLVCGMNLLFGCVPHSRNASSDQRLMSNLAWMAPEARIGRVRRSCWSALQRVRWSFWAVRTILSQGIAVAVHRHSPALTRVRVGVLLGRFMECTEGASTSRFG
jgi:hypothetical protein